MIGSIDAVSGFLLKKLRAALKDFCGGDRVILSSPHYKDMDFYVGICLYNIQDFSSAQTSAFSYEEYFKNVEVENLSDLEKIKKLDDLEKLTEEELKELKEKGFAELGENEEDSSKKRKINIVAKRRPPKLIELGYMVFTNEMEAFGGYAPEYGQQLLSETIRAVYENPFVGASNETPLSFAFLSADDKIKLWQAFTKPLQAALYINAGPVPIMPVEFKTFPFAEKRKTDVKRDVKKSEPDTERKE